MDNLDFEVKHELMRRELWIKVWSNTSNASTYTETCTGMANIAVKEFDKRFKAIEIS